MFEDKIKEKLRNDKLALEDTFKVLASMLSPDHPLTGSDRSMAALRAVLAELGITDPQIGPDEDARHGNEDLFRRNGLLYRTVNLEGKWWKNASGPFLATDDKGDFIALIPNFTGYYRLDTTTGKKLRVRTKTLKDLAPRALCFYRELPNGKLAVRDLFRYVRTSIRPRNLVLIVLLCTIVVLLEMLFPYANKVVFEEVVPSGKINGIFPIMSLLLGAGIGASLLEVTRNLLLYRVKDKFNANLQPAVMARVFTLPNRFFKERSAGDLAYRALSVNNIYQIITNEILSTLAVGLFGVMYLLMAFVYARQLIWFVTLVVVVFGVFTYYMYRLRSQRYDQIFPFKTAAQGFVYSLISGIHKIRNNGAEFRAMHQWATRFAKSEFGTADLSRFLTNSKSYMVLMVSASNLLMFYLSWHSHLGISDYIAFNAAFGMMMASFGELQDVMLELSQLMPQLKLIEPILEELPESGDTLDAITGISGAVELNNVSFAYSKEVPPVIKNISLKIRAGENVGLVGMSGCGKSTLLRLMMGFERPTSGTIFYDSYNLDSVSLSSFHHYTGYCPQEMHIFADTIRDNIKITAPEATDDEVWEAVRIACLDEDIRRLPNGLDWRLGEGGSGLSGGQCQRIMIARAVLAKPSIMFLDEATSALDNITQRKLVANLNTLKCTRISIAHRLSTIEQCDRIIVLDKGVIVEDGSPAELMERKGFFYNLAQRQKL